MSSVSRERVANASTIRGITVVLARICPSWTMRMALMRDELNKIPRAPASSARGPSSSAAARGPGSPVSHRSIWTARVPAPDVR